MNKKLICFMIFGVVPTFSACASDDGEWVNVVECVGKDACIDQLRILCFSHKGLFEFMLQDPIIHDCLGRLGEPGVFVALTLREQAILDVYHHIHRRLQVLSIQELEALLRDNIKDATRQVQMMQDSSLGTAPLEQKQLETAMLRLSVFLFLKEEGVLL